MSRRRLRDAAPVVLVAMVVMAAMVQLTIVPAFADYSSCLQSCNAGWQACRQQDGAECPPQCWSALEQCIETCCDEYEQESCPELQECTPET